MNIKEYLHLSKRKQKEFAEKCGLYEANMNFIANGKKWPSLYTALKIHLESGRMVDISSMLSEQHKKDLREKYRLSKKETIVDSCATLDEISTH